MTAPLLERLGLHRRELRAWAMYDWANSAFQSTIITAVFPSFFSDYAAAGLAPADATARFAWATTIAVAVIAVIGPILGAIRRRPGAQKAVPRQLHDDRRACDVTDGNHRSRGLAIRGGALHGGEHWHCGQLRLLRLAAPAHRRARRDGPRVHRSLRHRIPGRRHPAPPQPGVDTQPHHVRAA